MGNKKRQVDHSQADDASSDGENDGKPISNCPHVNKSVLLPTVKKAFKIEGLPEACIQCKRHEDKARKFEIRVEEDDIVPLYVCLRCGQCRCNGKLKHAAEHSSNCKSDPHDVAINLLDWSVRCFKCEQDISYQSTKNLQECYESIRKKGKGPVMNGNNKTTSSMESPTETPAIHYQGSFVIIPSVPDPLPKVRGLANLGNTCYFNSVLQCLAQTPFLLPILEEMRDGGDVFKLPGGEVRIGEDKKILEPLEGTLSSWEPLTAALAETLAELQSDKTDVYVPHRLRSILQEKCPQFAGCNEHDSHELLRQLLDIVRTEDLKRYQRGILDVYIEEKKKSGILSDNYQAKVKAYGQQASDLLLRPSQVFRGELVSILQCQKCKHSSDHLEHFLDLSLPVAADKPIHARRKISEETEAVSKHQLKKERRADVKRRRQRNKFEKRQEKKAKGDDESAENGPLSGDDSEGPSDADNEDEPEVEAPPPGHDIIESGYSSEKPGNGDSICGSPSADSQHTRLDTASTSAAESGVLDDNSSNLSSNGGTTVPAEDPSSSPLSKQTDCVEDGLMLMNNANGGSAAPTDDPQQTINVELNDEEEDNELRESSGPPKVIALPYPSDRIQDLQSDMQGLRVSTAGFLKSSSDSDISGKAMHGSNDNPADTPLDSEGQADCAGALDSPEDFGDGEERPSPGATLAPRVYNSNGCTLISCLNQFTAQELLTGNNRVGCESCTERYNGKGGKTMYTDASKQLLILNPPAILILHLKRFQVCKFTSRKNTETVTFKPILDLAPYCSVKCKSTPIVRNDQTEVRYALYGIVQHSGGMHGGHYVSYVKVRPRLSRDDPRWKYLPPGPSKLGSKASGEPDPPTSQLLPEGGPPDAPSGQWFHISDSHVSQVNEARVLNSEAYLLFYERIW